MSTSAEWASQYPGLVVADCWSCALEKLGDAGGITQSGAWLGHPSMYSRCGNKRCPCAAHHDNTCTRSNESGQEGSLYS